MYMYMHVLYTSFHLLQYCHLYNGSVVCELRDYRCHSVLDGYDKHLLLLRPTTEVHVHVYAQYMYCTITILATCSYAVKYHEFITSGIATSVSVV